MASKRVVTSAIANMTVGEVRRGLDMIRRRWRQRTAEQPFFMNESLFHGYTIEEFAFRFVMGHHYKRHNRDNDEGEEDEEEDLEEGEVEEEEEEQLPAPKRGRKAT
jgi:hypothetical protein